MIFTGERFIPNMELDSELEVEHLQRYYSIKDLVKGKIVVDAACGEGYGSFIMSETAEKVYGVDISVEAVSVATAKYTNSNLKFIKGSIEALPFEENSVDVLVSFETIEHVDEKIQGKFLKEAKRILKQDGVFIISTPDKKIYSDQYNYKNKFHIKEFYKGEFINFLKIEFQFIKMYNQYFEVVSLLNNLEKKDSIKTYSLEEEFHEAKYLVALVSNKPLEKFQEINSVFMDNNNKYNALVSRVLELQDEIDVKNRNISELNQGLEDINLEIKRLNCRVEELSLWGQSLDKEIENKNKKLLEHFKFEEMYKDERINHINKISDLEIQINEHMGKHNNIELLLLQSDKELERIKNSRSWKFMIYVWKFRDKIVPLGSKRRLLIKVGIKFLKHPIRFSEKLNPIYIRKFFFYLKREGASSVSDRLDEVIIKNSNHDLGINITQINATESKVYEVLDFEKLVFPIVEKPKVTIIIPVYNQIQYTYICLKSILENSKEVTYEVIIADDCSTDITVNIDKFVENISVITTKENLRFLLNCNNASKYAKGEYILFLNNDTQVQVNWLKPLVSLIEKDSSIGMVGSKLVYPDSRLQEAGGIIWNDASGWNYGRLSDPLDSEFSYVKECDYISGAAMMIKHSLWKEIGGFDERFVPAYYEDTDLAFEVRKHGHKVMLQPLSIVVHFEGISNGTDVTSGQKSYQVNNCQAFKEKWKEELSKQFKNGENVFVARDRSQGKKHILVVDHYVPHYDKDAGGKCTYMYIKLFIALGMKVTFIGDNFYPHQPYTSELQQMGVEVLYGNYYYNNWKKWLENNGKVFDYAYLNRPHISEKYIDLVRKYTNAKIIYFGHDLHYLRELREYEITGDKATLKSSNEWKEKEFDLFSKADVIYVVGSYEQEILKKEFKDKPIQNIPVYIYDNIRNDVNKNFMERENIIFVGGFGHSPNTDAVLWFGEKIFPSVLEKYSNIIWYIVGSKPPEKVKKLACPNIVVTGFISDEELSNLYEKSRLAIVPLRVGAGVKGKVVEAIYNQIPLITTPIGAEGLSLQENAFIVANTDKEFIDEAIDLYENFNKLKEISDNAITFIENHFTSEIAKKVVLLDIDIKQKGM